MSFTFSSFFDSCKLKLHKPNHDDLDALKDAWDAGKVGAVKRQAAKVKANLPANGTTKDLHVNLQQMITGYTVPPKVKPKVNTGANGGSTSSRLDVRGTAATPQEPLKPGSKTGGKRATAGAKNAESRSKAGASKAGSGSATPSSAGSLADKSPASSSAGPLQGLNNKSAEMNDIKAFERMLKQARDEVKGKTKDMTIEDPDGVSLLYQSHQYINEIIGEWQTVLTQKDEYEALLMNHSSWMLATLEELIKFPQEDDLPKMPDDLKAQKTIADQVTKSCSLARRLANDIQTAKETSNGAKKKTEDGKKRTPMVSDKDVKKMSTVFNDFTDNMPSINNKIGHLLASVGAKPTHKNVDSLKKTDDNLNLVKNEFDRMKREIDDSMAGMKHMEDRLKLTPNKRNLKDTLPVTIHRISDNVDLTLTRMEQETDETIQSLRDIEHYFTQKSPVKSKKKQPEPNIKDVIQQIDTFVRDTLQSNRNWEAHDSETTQTLENCQVILVNLLSTNDIESRRQTSNTDGKGNAAEQMKQLLLDVKKDVEAELNRLSRNVRSCESREQSLQEDYNKLKQSNEELKEEADDLRLRLSKIAGAKLSENNPNIADLSDPNRPTKLAEIYSELYDNEWTEAFHVLTETQNLSERAAIDVLLAVVQRAYTFSSEAAEAQAVGIKVALMYPMNVSGTMSSQSKAMGLSAVHRKVVTDLRKETAETTAKNLKKDFLMDIGETIRLPGEDNKSLDLNEKHFRVYVEACLILCFHMCVQSPPVYLDTGIVKQGSKFNKAIYKEYTKSGKYVDFVVWPLLQLQQDGDTLAKGVAQGC